MESRHLVNCASYSPDGAFVLAAFLDCAARIWSLHKGERIHILSLGHFFGGLWLWVGFYKRFLFGVVRVYGFLVFQGFHKVSGFLRFALWVFLCLACFF